MNFAWFFDAVVIGLLLVFIYLGGKRGFIHSILIICGYLISFILSLFICKTFSPVIYDQFISQKVEASLESKLVNIDIAEEIQKALNRENIGVKIDRDSVSDIINKADDNIINSFINEISLMLGETGLTEDDISSKIENIFSNSVTDKYLSILPDYVSDAVRESVINETKMLSDMIKSINSTPKNAASYIEQNIVRAAVIPIIQAVLFIVSFIILKIISGIFSKMIGGVNKIPIIGSLDTFLGIILGIIEGIAVILIIMIILRFLIALTGNEMIAFNTATIENTKIFKILYDLIKF